MVHADCCGWDGERDGPATELKGPERRHRACLLLCPDDETRQRGHRQVPRHGAQASPIAHGAKARMRDLQSNDSLTVAPHRRAPRTGVRPPYSSTRRRHSQPREGEAWFVCGVGTVTKLPRGLFTD